MGCTQFRNPRALSSALTALGMLQPRALRFLNRVDPLVSVSNLYVGWGIGEYVINYDCRMGDWRVRGLANMILGCHYWGIQYTNKIFQKGI